MVTFALARPFASELERRNLDYKPLLRQVGLEPSNLFDDDVFIGAQSWYDFASLAAQNCAEVRPGARASWMGVLASNDRSFKSCVIRLSRASPILRLLLPLETDLSVADPAAMTPAHIRVVRETLFETSRRLSAAHLV